MVCPVIGNHASCKIRAVISILLAKYISSAEIHCELCVVYSQDVMSEGTI